MRGKGSNRKTNTASSISDSVCYCNGDRELGTLELFCTGCSKWFHSRCFKDLREFYGLSFMVCYIFQCKDCSSSSTETWVAKQANFVHMCVTVLANLTAEQLRKEGKLDVKTNEKVFFGLREAIIPYFDSNWENLTSMPRRVKNTWHNTLQKTLLKDSDLFITNDDGNSFALNESLADIGPCNDAVKQIGKKGVSEKSNLTSTLVQSVAQPPAVVEDEGPKTRGASKRRNAEGGNGTGKKSKLAADYSSAKIAGLENAVDFPFNKEGCRYFLVEKDPNVSEKLVTEDDEPVARTIPSHLYRVAVNSTAVTLSPNDRAYQLRLSDDQLTVTGFEGYCMAKATHSVAKGTWYYEVNFLRQPPGSHIRIGWSQGLAVVQACVGYNKFSYGWRSLKGTRFHEGCGKKYHAGGFKEGDVLGMLIHLPHDSKKTRCSQEFLPPSRKEIPLINFKHNYFFEVQDDVAKEASKLSPLPGSKIEFFHNGRSCGIAYEDIYGGFYYPAVSLFGAAAIRVNFGPHLRHLPRGARPMCERPLESQHEQTLSDILHMVEHEHV